MKHKPILLGGNDRPPPGKKTPKAEATRRFVKSELPSLKDLGIPNQGVLGPKS